MPALAATADSRRPTRLLVDLQAIAANAAIIRKRISSDARLMAVIKANAYGHGAVPVAGAALAGGATYLGVATVSEAIELRNAGIDAPVLVLSSSDPAEAPAAADRGISIGVGDAPQARAMLDQLEVHAPGRPLAVHLKVDTGMLRFGVSTVEAPLLARLLAGHRRILLEGVYSHFAESDAESTARIDEQMVHFKRALVAITAAGVDPGIAHISNSAALLRDRTADNEMVRAGICLYGISPSRHVPLFQGMRGALEWRAKVQHIVNLTPGDRCGYGGTYVATEHERIALLPFGYADGYPRHLSNLGWVLWQGCRLPVRGRVSMDQCAVGIPPGVELQVGDEVTVLGAEEGEAPSANDLASVIDTIGYEIVSRISRRVPVDYLPFEVPQG